MTTLYIIIVDMTPAHEPWNPEPYTCQTMRVGCMPDTCAMESGALDTPTQATDTALETIWALPLKQPGYEPGYEPGYRP